MEIYKSNTTKITSENFECKISKKRFISYYYMKKNINIIHKDQIKEVINSKKNKLYYKV